MGVLKLAAWVSVLVFLASTTPPKAIERESNRAGESAVAAAERTHDGDGVDLCIGCVFTLVTVGLPPGSSATADYGTASSGMCDGVSPDNCVPFPCDLGPSNDYAGIVVKNETPYPWYYPGEGGSWNRLPGMTADERAWGFGGGPMTCPKSLLRTYYSAASLSSTVICKVGFECTACQ